MKTIVVTGGEGFIGKHLISLLMKNNFKIISIDKKLSNKKNNFYYKKETSIKNFFKKKKNLRNIIGIVHLAAESRNTVSFTYPLKTLQKSLLDTLVILESIRYSKNKPWIIFSSTKQIEIDRKKNLFSPYSIAKDSCEKLIKFYSLHFNINSTILRFSDVFGTIYNNKQQVLIKMIRALKNNRRFHISNPVHKLNYVHVEDICDYILFLIKKDLTKNYKIIKLYGKKIYTLKEITFLAKKVLNSKSKILVSNKKLNNKIDTYKMKNKNLPIFTKKFKKELKLIKS